MRSHPTVSSLQLCVLLLSMLNLAGCGGGGSAVGGGSNPPPPPPPPPAEFLYAATLGGQVTTLDIDSSNGSLTSAGSSAGSNGVSIAVNPAGTFLYAADLSTNAIDGLSISSTGALSTISGSPFSAPGDGGILGVAVDPSGKFLYATTDTASGGSGTGLVVVFSIDSTTGALSPVAGSPFPAGVSPTELVVAPSGQFLYVSDSASGILAFSVASGTLTPIAGSPFPSGSRGLAVTPGAAYLYAIDVDNVVSAFSIDSATGALTQVSGSPFLDSAGSGNFTGVVIVDPTGSFLYTYNTFGAPNTISGFAVDSSTGALSPVAGSPFSTGETTFSAANLEIEPSGKFIYASCADGNCGILEFSIDATTGALTPATGAPFDLEFYVGGLAAVSLQ